MADAATSFIKLWAGHNSDGKPGRRKKLMVWGYGLSNLARPLLGLVSSWGALLLLRSLDRAGKGIRNAPRDALLADSTPPAIHGYAYGFHRAMDNAGALGGTLLAIAALSWLNWSVSEVIVWSVVPGMLVLVVVIFGVRDPPRLPVAELLKVEQEKSSVPPPFVLTSAWSLLSPDMRRYLWVLALFTFARASESFILLRGHELGMSVVHVLLLWATLNVSKASTSMLGGRLADKFGMRRLTLISWSGLAFSFFLLSLVEQDHALWVVTIVYGLLIGLGEGSERALISVYANEGERGMAFGWYHLSLGLSAIPAGLLFGAVWHYWNANMAFLFTATLTIVCILLLRFWSFQNLSIGGKK